LATGSAVSGRRILNPRSAIAIAAGGLSRLKNAKAASLSVGTPNVTAM